MESVGLSLSTMLHHTGEPHCKGDTGLKQVCRYEKCFVNSYERSQNWANPNTPSGPPFHSTHHSSSPNPQTRTKARGNVHRWHSSCAIFRVYKEDPDTPAPKTEKCWFVLNCHLPDIRQIDVGRHPVASETKPKMPSDTHTLIPSCILSVPGPRTLRRRWYHYFATCS